MNQAQEDLLGCYRTLEELLRNHSEELVPFEHRNAVKAFAALWQVANGLDADPGHVYELGA